MSQPADGGPRADRGTLRRSRTDRHLAGVAGGIARYLGVDSDLVRLGLVGLTFAGFAGPLIYLATYILVPEDGDDRTVLQRGINGEHWPLIVLFGGALLVIGGLDGGDRPFGDIGSWLPVVLIGGGFYLLYQSRDRQGAPGPGPSTPTSDPTPGTGTAGTGAVGVVDDRPPAGPVGGDDQPGTSAGDGAPRAGGTDDTDRSGAPTGGTTAGDTAPAPGTPGPGAPAPAASAPTAPAAATPPPPLPPPPRPPVPPTPHWNRGGFGAHAPSGPAHAYEVVTAAGPPPEPRSRSIITPIVLSALAVLVGLAVLLDRWSIASPDRTVWWAAALAIVALGLFVSAWAGRARGLVALALFLSAGLVIETTASPEILFSAGERIHEPRSLEGTTTYELGAGEMRVDLSGTDFGEEPATVEARVQAGELTVIVPDDVDVEIVADATMGELTLFGENTSGIGVDRTIDAEDDPDVLLDLHVGMGTIVVDRVPAAEDDAAESEGTTRTTSERGDGTSATAVTTPAPESSTPSPESSVPPTTAAGAS